MSDYCDVANQGCKNPPAYGVGGGGYFRNPDPPRTRVECSLCGDKACSACRVKRGQRYVCALCDREGATGE